MFQNFKSSITMMNWHQQNWDGENIHNDSKTCCLHSRLWRFLLFCEEQNEALLLYYAREEVFDIFETLLKHEKSNFDGAITNITDYFRLKKSVEFEIHRFLKEKQIE